MAPSPNYPSPPVPPPSWSYTPESITSTVKASIATTSAVLDSVVALPKSARTFETVVRPLALRDGEDDKETAGAVFMQYVAMDDKLRDAAVAGNKELQDFGLSTITRLDIFEALLDAQKHTEENGIKLNPEEQRLMDRMLLDRRRNGLALNPEKRAELLEIKKKIMSLVVDFQRNCNEEKGSLLFTAEELDGVPEEIVSGYPKEGDKYRVTFKTPDIIPLFKYANLPATRKAAVLGYEGRALVNTPLLKEIVSLRRQVASILGFETYAAWVLEVKMAKTPKTVFDFLEDLEAKLRPLGLAEKEKLLALKKAEHEKRGWEVDDKLYLWDYRYYDRLWTERELNLDEEKVSEYFPVSKVVPAILEIYQRLLSVRFFLVPRTEEHGGFTWHEEAEMYAVWDAGKDGADKGKFLGYMHLDLFPRENKYGHAAVWGLIPGWTKADGTRSWPVVCMVANLAKPTPTRPALMKHNDAVTFMHEMGHAFHGLCSETQFARFHGTAVARDFVEAPSQMLEHWCWTPAQLKEISSHYETNEQLPDELISALIKSKTVNQGLFQLRQLFHGMYDMILHTSEKDEDQTKLWVDLREKISLVTTDGEYVGGQSSYAHIVGGYEAGYYGYLYSQSFSADMFKTVFSANPMDPQKGQLYRDTILRPGGSRPEMDSLVAFLGREPNSKAFMESLLGPPADGASPKL